MFPSVGLSVGGQVSRCLETTERAQNQDHYQYHYHCQDDYHNRYHYKWKRDTAVVEGFWADVMDVDF